MNKKKHDAPAAGLFFLNTCGFAGGVSNHPPHSAAIFFEFFSLVSTFSPVPTRLNWPCLLLSPLRIGWTVGRTWCRSRDGRASAWYGSCAGATRATSSSFVGRWRRDSLPNCRARCLHWSTNARKAPLPDVRGPTPCKTQKQTTVSQTLDELDELFFLFFRGFFLELWKLRRRTKKKKKSPFLVGGCVCLGFVFCVLVLCILAGSLHMRNLPPGGVATVSIVVERGQTCLFNIVFQNVIDHWPPDAVPVRKRLNFISQ